MYSNLTLISSNNNYRLFIIIHLIICSLYYRHTLLSIYKKMNHISPIIKYMIHLSAIMMIIGSLFPYTYLGLDLLSKCHVFFSMTSSLLLLIILFLYNYYFSLYNSSLYKQTHYFIETGLSFLCLIIICFGHINGYIEMIFCFIITYYIHLLKKQFNIK